MTHTASRGVPKEKLAAAPAPLKPPRNQSLDALRGYAILTMVLSGAIAYGGVLPAWMYHAQVPPPVHRFNPAIPGITWVDLVFPFFLFSMGAAIPLSMASLLEVAGGWKQVVVQAVRRLVLLTWFALFTFHMRAWVIAETPGVREWLLSILAFGLLCFQLFHYRGERHRRLFAGLRIAAYLVAAFLLYRLPFNNGAGFRLDKVDIIILVLGNMAFFGTLLWWATRQHPWLRVGVLPLVMAVFLGAKEAGSWNETVFNWSPLPWMYRFYYLKYLFIVVPGTFAGEWLLQSFRKKLTVMNTRSMQVPAILSFSLVGVNVALLFSRQLVPNLVLSVLVGGGIGYLLHRSEAPGSLLRRCWQAGFYLLVLGLFFEAFEGGMRKDSSTYSYYFVCSGLAFFMLIGFNGLASTTRGRGVNQYLSLNGRNPMVAYVAGNLLLTPLLQLTGAIALFEAMNGNVWMGFLKGVLFTGLVSLITILFTRRGWFWKI